ncbi:MAG: (2Fe-2S)-binding protein [Coriobacteriales bacterium]|jgi:NADH dehydrogenase/NADH:ubiquinone oxidoreductase subunit G|nr:(2Fe-2S)-binding protein [Coriobacteriales bacterium]
MSGVIQITIDGKVCECEKGEFLLEVCKRNGIFIPTLCFHQGLGGLGACRLCIVEVVQRGRSKVVVSCIYPVEGEIEVHTQSDTIKEQRGVILTLLHHLAPNAEVITQMAKFMGVALPRLADKPDGDKCVLCGRCTTACELLGTGAIAKVNRGTTKEIATPYHEQTPECVGCGSCAHVCPTGAIAFSATEEDFTIWNKTFELLRCGQCGKPYITRAQFEFLRDKRGEPAEPLCDECEKKATARLMKDSEHGFGGVRELLRL